MKQKLTPDEIPEEGTSLLITLEDGTDVAVFCHKDNLLCHSIAVLMPESL